MRSQCPVPPRRPTDYDSQAPPQHSPPERASEVHASIPPAIWCDPHSASQRQAGPGVCATQRSPRLVPGSPRSVVYNRGCAVLAFGGHPHFLQVQCMGSPHQASATIPMAVFRICTRQCLPSLNELTPVCHDEAGHQSRLGRHASHWIAMARVYVCNETARPVDSGKLHLLCRGERA